MFYCIVIQERKRTEETKENKINRLVSQEEDEGVTGERSIPLPSKGEVRWELLLLLLLGVLLLWRLEGLEAGEGTRGYTHTEDIKGYTNLASVLSCTNRQTHRCTFIM